MKQTRFIRSMVFTLAATACMGGIGHSATIIRGFEESTGTFTTQYPEFTIATDTPGATLEVYSFTDYASEGDNFLTIQVSGLGAVGDGIFTALVGNQFEGVSLNGIESTAGTTVATILLFDGVTSLGSISVLAPGSGTTPVNLDFTSYGNVSRFEIRDVTDVGGFAIDRIVVNTSAVPEPTSSLLACLGGLAMLRHRKRPLAAR